MHFPKILVISNNCFSLSSNNGRTLGNFFSGLDREKIAQFYIKAEKPQEDICGHYMCVTDGMVLDLFTGKKPIKRTNDSIGPAETKTKPIKRNAITMLIRYLIWHFSSWGKYFGFDKFVNEFAPEAVLLQAGDTPHMYDLARKISYERNIPLFIYNSEDYVMRRYDYFEDTSFLTKLAFPVFRKILHTSFVKALKQTNHVIYISQKLQRSYSEFYSHQSSVIYTSTATTSSSNKAANDPLKISYFGNLNLGRYVSLIELANAFAEADPRIRIDVYGDIASSEINNALKSCESICAHGFVPYEDIKRVMIDSDILLHAESFLEQYQSINANYFTTKIADCLASGRAFLAYAPAHIAFMEYLRDNDAAILITSPEDIKEIVKKTVFSEAFRTAHIEKAKMLAVHNHDFVLNRESFQRVIMDGCRKV